MNELHPRTKRPDLIKALGVFPIGLQAIQPGPMFATPPDKGLGINLPSVYYWSPTLPFVDVFKQTDEWIHQREGSQSWNTGERLDLDQDGWVRFLSPGQIAARTVSSVSGTKHWPLHLRT